MEIDTDILYSPLQKLNKQNLNEEIKTRFDKEIEFNKDSPKDSPKDKLPHGHVIIYEHISTAELAELPESEFNPLYEKLKTAINEMLSKNIYSCYEYNDKWFNISFLHNAFLIRQSKK